MLKILEISYAEEQEKAITQLEMNLTAAEMYHLWDNTLNIIGGLNAGGYSFFWGLPERLHLC